MKLLIHVWFQLSLQVFEVVNVFFFSSNSLSKKQHWRSNTFENRSCKFIWSSMIQLVELEEVSCRKDDTNSDSGIDHSHYHTVIDETYDET